MSEATSLGAAIAAGRAVGVWEIKKPRVEDGKAKTFEAKIGDAEREEKYKKWNKTVEKSLGWVDN
jgi:glycerol kinase